MSEPSHIFISYASEDRTFAEWLARKLAAAGYAVWLDTLKMLGGEQWPQTIDEALIRSGRLLALMSANSVKKDLPVSERTKALSIGRSRGVSDFLIPLRLDDSEWDWTLHNHTGISFAQGWASGWRQLLKKLLQIKFPRILSEGAFLAQQSMEPEHLLLHEPETLRLNVVRADIMEKVLHVFSLPLLTEDASKVLKQNWGCFIVGDKAIALGQPQGAFAEGVKLTPAKHLWAAGGEFMGVAITSILPALVRATMWARLRRIGCVVHPKKSAVFYLPETFTENGRLTFTDIEGKSRTHKIRRYNTVRRGLEKEKVYFHFAFRCDLAKGLCAGFYVQIVPTLMLFDVDGIPIVDDRVNRLRRKITRGYYNAEWRDRFLAAEQLLIATQAAATDGITLASTGISLIAPSRLNEALFEKGSTAQADVVDSDDAGELVDDEQFTAFDNDEE